MTSQTALPATVSCHKFFFPLWPKKSKRDCDAITAASTRPSSSECHGVNPRQNDKSRARSCRRFYYNLDSVLRKRIKSYIPSPRFVALFVFELCAIWMIYRLAVQRPSEMVGCLSNSGSTLELVEAGTLSWRQAVSIWLSTRAGSDVNCGLQSNSFSCYILSSPSVALLVGCWTQLDIRTTTILVSGKWQQEPNGLHSVRNLYKEATDSIFHLHN